MKGGPVTQKLRGLDPTTLEVQLPTTVARPLGLVSLVNVADLIALRERQDVPAAIARQVRGYRDRVARELSDLPNGTSFLGFLEKLSGISPEMMPASFREMVISEGTRDGRGSAERSAVAELAETWEDVEPLEFEIAAPPVRSQVKRFAPGKTPRASPSSSSRAPAARRSATPSIDEDQIDFVSGVVLERLASRTDSGLAEGVLVAGVRHRARGAYPNLAPHVVTGVLKDLLKRGKISYSAGRWKYAGRR